MINKNIGFDRFKNINKRGIENEIKKIKQKYELVFHWLEIEISNKDIIDFFYDRSVKSVAIYGMNDLGYMLYKKLVNSEVNVKYAIDNGIITLGRDEIKTVYIDDILEPVDMIIVAAIYQYESDCIKKVIEQRISTQVISLEELIYSF